MSRYIDADALMNQWCDEMCKPKPSCEEDCAVYDYVRLAPSIDIVFCKECVEYDDEWCLYWQNVVNAYDFCSYGERKESSDGK